MAPDDPDEFGEKIEEGARRVAQVVAKGVSSADRRTQLAADRTLLAAERTYAAWVRTGLGALASGIGARALLEGVVSDWLVMTTAIMLLLFSEFCFIAGIWRQLQPLEPPAETDLRRIPATVLVLFNLFLVVLGIAVIIGIIGS